MTESDTSYVSLAATSTQLARSLYTDVTVLDVVPGNFAKAAKVLGGFARALRRISSSLRKDNSVASVNALETVQVICRQAEQILDAIKAFKNGHHGAGNERSTAESEHMRMVYLTSHLESLTLTLAAMLQAFQVVFVERISNGPSIDTAPILDNIGVETMDLENIVIEQQLSLIRTFQFFESYRQQFNSSSERETKFFAKPQSEKTLISEETQALLSAKRIPDTTRQNALEIVAGSKQTIRSQQSGELAIDAMANEAKITATHLEFLLALPSSQYGTIENSKMLTGVARDASIHAAKVLHQWTTFKEAEERWQQRSNGSLSRRQLYPWDKQATVETAPESEDEIWNRKESQITDINLAAPVPRRVPSPRSILSQPLFAPLPKKSHPDTPSTMSPRTSVGSQINFASTAAGQTSQSGDYFAPSPRSSVQSIPPIRAAAAAIDKELENGEDLEIPWRLCLHNSYWDHVDSKIVSTNTHLQPTEAYRDRKGFTEILASWVCREALEQMMLDYTLVQKSTATARNSKFEAAFIVHTALHFVEVQRLVERTVEIVQEKADLTHSTRRPPEHQGSLRVPPLIPSHPPLDRSISSPAGPVSPSHMAQYAGLGTNHANSTLRRPSSRRSSVNSHGSQRSTYSHRGYTSPALSFSESGSEDSEEDRRERRRARKDKATKPKGSSKRTMGTLAKIGGAVALLEGLEHAF